jgi:hypothetical protein
LRREYNFLPVGGPRPFFDYGTYGNVYPADSSGNAYITHGLDVPAWTLNVVAAIGAIGPAGFVTMLCVRVRGSRRAGRLGLCRKCGYDLRASKERCPECGTPIPLDKTRGGPPPKDLKPPDTDPPAEPLPPG